MTPAARSPSSRRAGSRRERRAAPAPPPRRTGRGARAHAPELAPRRRAAARRDRRARSSWRSCCSPKAAPRRHTAREPRQRNDAPPTRRHGGPHSRPALRARARRRRGARPSARVAILSEGGKRAFYIAAEHLPPTQGTASSTTIWLYNSPTSNERAERSARRSASNGQLAGGALLPTNAAEYHELLLTRETSATSDASRPGRAARPASASAAEREQLAGVHDPGRVELALDRRQRARAPARRSRAPSRAGGRARRRGGG